MSESRLASRKTIRSDGATRERVALQRSLLEVLDGANKVLQGGERRERLSATIEYGLMTKVKDCIRAC